MITTYVVASVRCDRTHDVTARRSSWCSDDIAHHDNAAWRPLSVAWAAGASHDVESMRRPAIGLDHGTVNGRRVTIERRGSIVTERHELDGAIVHLDRFKCDTVDEAAKVAAHRVRMLTR